MTSEEWREVSSATFEGVGETRDRASREVNSEALRLVEMAGVDMVGETFYIAKVGHNEMPTVFQLTTCSEGHAVFENPEHDFPKRLEYQLDAEGRLVVTVSDGAATDSHQPKGFRLLFQRTE